MLTLLTGVVGLSGRVLIGLFSSDSSCLVETFLRTRDFLLLSLRFIRFFRLELLKSSYSSNSTAFRVLRGEPVPSFLSFNTFSSYYCWYSSSSVVSLSSF